LAIGSIGKTGSSSGSARPRIAARLREQLADDNADVRLAAIVRLGGIGELDDIALLSDLLFLPKADDEHPLEREAMVDAMLRISQRTSE